LLAAAAAIGLTITRSRYFDEMIRESVGWGELARYRLEDWGELVINTSMAKLPAMLQRAIPLLGAAGAAIAVWGVSCRARLDLVAIYTLSYTAILLVWPYRDARFWLPVFPFLAAFAWLAYERAADRRLVRLTAKAYVAAFCLLGAAALFYSSRISLSGKQFPDVYGGGIYRASYRASFGERAVASTNADVDLVDPKLVKLIQRYGARN
jgi:hypothetical protein